VLFFFVEMVPIKKGTEFIEILKDIYVDLYTEVLFQMIIILQCELIKVFLSVHFFGMGTLQ